MGAASPDSGDLIEVEPARPGSPVAVVTINRPAALNALTMVSLAAAFRRLGADNAVAAVVLAGRGRAFCCGVDLTAAEEVFKGDVKDVATNPVAQMELCRKPIVGVIAGFAVTAGFEIALACEAATSSSPDAPPSSLKPTPSLGYFLPGIFHRSFLASLGRIEQGKCH